MNAMKDLFDVAQGCAILLASLGEVDKAKELQRAVSKAEEANAKISVLMDSEISKSEGLC